jgi:hypothetical protein
MATHGLHGQWLPDKTPRLASSSRDRARRSTISMEATVALVTASVSFTLSSPLLYRPPLTDQVKSQKAPPLLLEKWSLLISSTQAEPWPIGGVPQALGGRLLLSASHVNDFGSPEQAKRMGRTPGRRGETETRRHGEDAKKEKRMGHG